MIRKIYKSLSRYSLTDRSTQQISIDEASVQLQGHLYEAIAMQPGQDKKEDYHYTREGVQAKKHY
jgi:hypothetical protein